MTTTYFIAYTSKRHSIQEEFEPCLTSHQVICIIDTLFNGVLSNDEAISSTEVPIDINTLVAIMSSSKIPPRTTNLEETPNLPEPQLVPSKEEKKTSDILLKRLVDSFDSKRIHDRKKMNLNESDRSQHDLKLINQILETCYSKNSNIRGDVSLNFVCLFLEFKIWIFSLFLEIFKIQFSKHFLINNGIKTFLHECDSNLTYLNVYRKNHLKHLLNLSTTSIEKSLSYEEALQTKAK